MAKICDKEGCNNPSFSKGKCKYHYKRKPIKKISQKHTNLLKEYRKVRADLIKEKDSQECEIKSPNCTYYFQGIHHIAGKETQSKYLDKNNMLLACNACNLYVEENVKWALDKGFKKQRHGE